MQWVTHKGKEGQKQGQGLLGRKHSKGPRGLEEDVCDNGQNAYICEMVKELKIKNVKAIKN